MAIGRLRLAGLMGLFLAQPGMAGRPPAPPTEGDSDEIVVTAFSRPGDIVVNGRAIRCRALRGDPQEAALHGPGSDRRDQSVLVPSESGRTFIMVEDRQPTTGPRFWQRAGNAINEYVYRTPTDGSPLCIGARHPVPKGYGQLRRILDARPYRGKRVRFTAWVATRDAYIVRFWLAADYVRFGKGSATDGGNSNNQNWGGEHGWTPVLLEMGPVSRHSDFLSYGFLLQGSGSVWLYDPKIEVVEPNDAFARGRDVIVIGGKEQEWGAGDRR